MKESDLTKEWLNVSLEDLVDILDSERIPVNSKERAKRIGPIPYYGATGQVGWIDDFIFGEELVLVGEDGAPFLERGKKKAYIINGKSWVNNHAHVLRAKNNLTSNQFLCHFFNQFTFNEYVNGTTRLKLTQGSMRKIPVPLPPLYEQHRIVEKLDKLLPKVEACKKRLDKIPTILNRFKQSVLAAACSGELTKGFVANHPDDLFDSRLKKLSSCKYKEKLHGHDVYAIPTKSPLNSGVDSLDDLPKGWKYTFISPLLSKTEKA